MRFCTKFFRSNRSILESEGRWERDPVWLGGNALPCRSARACWLMDSPGRNFLSRPLGSELQAISGGGFKLSHVGPTFFSFGPKSNCSFSPIPISIPFWTLFGASFMAYFASTQIELQVSFTGFRTVPFCSRSYST